MLSVSLSVLPDCLPGCLSACLQLLFPGISHEHLCSSFQRENEHEWLWWEIDLEEQYYINYIEVLPRGDCCREFIKR